MLVLSYIVIGLGVLFIAVGVLGMFLPGKDFYFRILLSCKVDTVGILTVALGLMIRHGISFFSGKVLLVLVITVVLGPLVTHIMARAAHNSGYLPAYTEASEEELP